MMNQRYCCLLYLHNTDYGYEASAFSRDITNGDYLQLLPREGFKTITVKNDVFKRFTDVMELAKKENPSMSNSRFLAQLLNLYERDRDNTSIATD
jgi:hypothetical protein